MTNANSFMMLDRIIQNQPLILEFIDAFSGRNLTELTITITGSSTKKFRPVRTPSGFFLIYGMEPGEYSLRAEADGFEPWEATQTIADQQPPLQIALNPSTAYQFPFGSTVVRGMVFTGPQTSPMPSPGKTITLAIAGTTLSAVSSQKGEFLFYLSNVTNGNRIENGGVWYVRSPSASYALAMSFTPATSYTLEASPAEAAISSTEFVWKIGTEVHINLFT